MDGTGPAADAAPDEVILHRLRHILAAADPPPPGLQETGCGLLTWRSVDAELAELLRASPAAVD